jgi:hypothetical protein
MADLPPPFDPGSFEAPSPMNPTADYRVETVDYSETHEHKITSIVASESECTGRAIALKLTSGTFACAVADA